MVFFNTDAENGPLAQQPVARGTRLQYRQPGQRHAGFGAERIQVEILPDTRSPRRIDPTTLQIEQPGWLRRHATGHIHQPHGGVERWQRGTVLEIARHPATLHGHRHGAVLQLQRGDDHEALAPSHLPVVEEDRVLSQPVPAQRHRPVQYRLRRFLSGQGAPVERGLALALVDGRLQGLLLRRAVELPTPQGRRGGHAGHSGGGHQPEAPIGLHASGRHGIMPIMVKILLLLGFLAIVASLGSALFFMMRTGHDDASRGKRMARALAWRVGLSVVLFACLLLAWKLGYIQPTGLPAAR